MYPQKPKNEGHCLFPKPSICTGTSLPELE